MTDETSEASQRREKLAELRKRGNPYPNDFRRNAVAAEVCAQHDSKDAAVLEEEKPEVAIAGRMMTRRIMGKASFAHLQDVSGKIQIYVRRDDLPEGAYAEFKQWNLGDILGVEGFVFKTRTGELSVHASSIRLLVKSLMPLPEKFHGLADLETRYRQRYVDLIVNEDTRRTFRTRARVTDYLRKFFNQRDYLEVETPMMQVIPGGAVARPFKTHHNVLDMDLYLRIAPELFLKRLVVGGFERVYEINRNFRNEGVSTQHNPEFTMLEFYGAYQDFNDYMDLTEEMMRGLAKELTGSTEISYQGERIDFDPAFERLTVREAILKHNPGIKGADLDDDEKCLAVAKKLGIDPEDTWGRGKLWVEVFEKTVEDNLKSPTFITAYPTEVSPLSRRNDEDAFVTDRFEFFVGGREIANGFSELNDPEDQAERFRNQVRAKEAGDLEAMHFDEDYIRSLEYGMPPTAGEGVGIDRLVMLFTDSPSIRDVLLFPYMRPETGSVGDSSKENDEY
ncbi:MAG TPA: lysine--tRNA ligase [Gammaproteobacteria bacterium]|nr:lysine--tRNA ligase [Gammaproteobacteria bacterium]